MPCVTSTWRWSTFTKPWAAAGRNNPAGFFGLSVCPDPSSDPGFLFPGRRFVASFPKTLFAMPLRNAFPRESSSRRAVIRSPGSGIGIVPACRCPLCGSDQSRTLFFPHLGRMSRNISKFIPGMGRPSTETYSSSKRFLTAALTEKSAQRADNSFSSVTSFIR